MMDLFKTEYIDVMKRALEGYGYAIRDHESINGTPHPNAEDLENIEMMLKTLAQLPAFMEVLSKTRGN